MEQGRVVVVGNKKVVVSYLVMEIVVRIMMNNLMDWMIRHKVMMGLMMDNLMIEIYNWSSLILDISHFRIVN